MGGKTGQRGDHRLWGRKTRHSGDKDLHRNLKTNPENLSNKGRPKPTSKPANEGITDSEVITDFNPCQPDEVGALASAPVAYPRRSPSASACEPYREAIELGLSGGHNAVPIYQALADEYNRQFLAAVELQSSRN